MGQGMLCVYAEVRGCCVCAEVRESVFSSYHVSLALRSSCLLAWRLTSPKFNFYLCLLSAGITGMHTVPDFISARHWTQNFMHARPSTNWIISPDPLYIPSPQCCMYESFACMYACEAPLHSAHRGQKSTSVHLEVELQFCVPMWC